MTKEDSQTETGEVFLASFDLIAGTSESTRAKTAETFLELLGARVRNPNTRSAYQVAWRSFLAFCSARKLELGSVKAYHVGAWLDQHPGSRSTQRQHLAAVRLLFDSLMMRGVAVLQLCRSSRISWADMVLAPSVAGLFKWRQFEPEVILLAVGWYLRFSLSYRDVEELLAERGLHADHVTVWRWVQRYAPEMERHLRSRLKPTNDSWRVDETYIRSGFGQN